MYVSMGCRGLLDAAIRRILKCIVVAHIRRVMNRLTLPISCRICMWTVNSDVQTRMSAIAEYLRFSECFRI